MDPASAMSPGNVERCYRPRPDRKIVFFDISNLRLRILSFNSKLLFFQRCLNMPLYGIWGESDLLFQFWEPSSL